MPLQASDFREFTRSLNETIELFHTILNMLPEGLVVVDTDYRVIYLNEQYAEMIGYPIEEVVGKNLHDLIHHSNPDGTPLPIEQCPVYQRLQNLEKGWRFEGEGVMWNSAGKPIMVRARMSVIHTSGHKGLLVLATQYNSVEKRQDAETLEFRFL